MPFEVASEYADFPTGKYMTMKFGRDLAALGWSTHRGCPRAGLRRAQTIRWTGCCGFAVAHLMRETDLLFRKIVLP